MKYIELTNASTFKLDKFFFNVDYIEGLMKPQKENIGCIVLINQIKYPVKEDYEWVCTKLTQLTQNT